MHVRELWLLAALGLLLLIRPVASQTQEVLVFEETPNSKIELPDRLPCVVWDSGTRPWCLLRHASAGTTDLVLTRQRAEAARIANARRGAVIGSPNAALLEIVWQVGTGAGSQEIRRRSFGLSANAWSGDEELVDSGAGVGLEAVVWAGETLVMMARHGEQSLRLHLRGPAAKGMGPISVVERTPVRRAALAASEDRIVAAYTTMDGLCFVRPWSFASGRFEDAVGVPVGTSRPFRSDADDPIDVATWRDLVYLTMVDRSSAKSLVCCWNLSEHARWVAHDLPVEWRHGHTRLGGVDGVGRAKVVGTASDRLVVATAYPGRMVFGSKPGTRVVEDVGLGTTVDRDSLVLLTTSLPPSRTPLQGHVLRLAIPEPPIARVRPVGRRSEAINQALHWLARHQDADGRWDCQLFQKHDKEGEPCTGAGRPVNDVGVTGLATLCFLSDGGNVQVDPHRDVVRRALRWLAGQQNHESGLIGQNASSAYVYSHAIATQALVRGYGVSGADWLRGPARQAIKYITDARNPYGVWRYKPRDNDNDTSVTAWCTAALVWARSCGLEVDEPALKSATIWFDGVTDATGASGYLKVGDGSNRPVGKQARFPNEKTEALTAAVLLCRYLLELDPKDSKTMGPAADLIMRKPPVWNPNDGSIDMYYWYFASHAMYHVGGSQGDTWAKKMTDAAIKTQLKEGNPKGTWDPIDPWGEDGGRVYSTAIMCLALQWDTQIPRK